MRSFISLNLTLFMAIAFSLTACAVEPAALTLNEYLEVKKNVGKHMAFQEDAETVFDAITSLSVAGHAEKVKLLSSKLKGKNLSFFLFTTNKNILKEFDVTMDDCMQVLQIRLKYKQSLIMPKDIYNFQCTKKSKNEIVGSFNFEVLNSVKGRCLFKAEKVNENWEIQKIVLARKNSNKINKGLDIDGVITAMLMK